jgi:hypothetical protein
MLLLAGAAGIEPTQTVLETVVLPLYDAPVITSHSIVLVIRYMLNQTASISILFRELEFLAHKLRNKAAGRDVDAWLHQRAH